MIDIGSGPPVVVIPGINGRWEMLRPAIESLAARCRVVTSSLPEEPGSHMRFSPALGFDNFTLQIDELFVRAGLGAAALCGISFGGLIALRYAARHPERVSALILVSSLGPHWRPNRTAARYMRWPLLLGPLFFVGTFLRVIPELRRAFPSLLERIRFCASVLRRLVGAPAIPTRMSRRARAAAGEDFVQDCARIVAPTLIVTGEADFDRIIGVRATMECAQAIRGAQVRVLDRTGHLGVMTAPDRFAEIVGDFVLANGCKASVAAR